MLNLSPASLDWALAHVKKEGDTDVFPRPFEIDAISDDWSEVREHLEKQDIHNWSTYTQRSLLAPKSFWGFRIVTQLDPLDTLIFTAVLYEIGADLEKNRVPVKKGCVFSHRFNPKGDGTLYDPEIGYHQFRKAAEELTSRRGYTHVAVTDIADFFPRIYSHRLENALSAYTNKSCHVTAIRKLLHGWNATESHGIPVGPAASRLLADIAIHDVDEALLGNGIKFVRFIDDYRLFAHSESEAFRYLTVLAETLYQNHGLTLNPQKTRICTIDQFRNSYLSAPEDRQVDSLRSRFQKILKELRIQDPYGEIHIAELPPKAQQELSEINLRVLLEQEIVSGGADVDYSLVRFVLRRMAQVQDDSAIDALIQKIESLHPVLPEIIEYFRALNGLGSSERYRIGQKITTALKKTYLAELPYYQMWGLNLFCTDSTWNSAHLFEPMLRTATDQFTRRQLILAIGRARKRHWFQSRWRHLFDESEWCRRALIFAASCLEKDAYSHWGNAVKQRLSILERSVLKFGKAHPMR